MPDPHDSLFRSLADPTRRALFERLCRDGEQTVGALTAQAGISQPAVSKHLGVLKQAGQGAVVGLAAFVAVAHEPGRLQHREMFRNGRLGDAGLGRQGPDRLLAVAAQAFEQRPPGRVGEGPEQQVVSGGHRIDNLVAMGYFITIEIWVGQVRHCLALALSV